MIKTEYWLPFSAPPSRKSLNSVFPAFFISRASVIYYGTRQNRGFTIFLQKISTRLLLVAIGFCLVLSNAAEPYFQGFCGIDGFIWERPDSSISAERV